MDISIVRVGEGDADLLQQVADEVFDAPIDPLRLRAFLADARHLMVLAMHGGTVVGQGRGIIHLNPDEPSELYIDNMGVSPRFQRQGCGARLLEELLQWGAERGCEHAWLATEPDNTAARALYAGRLPACEPMILYGLEGLARR